MTFSHPYHRIARADAAPKPAPAPPPPPKLGALFAQDVDHPGVRVGFDVETGHHLLICGPSAAAASVIRSVARGSLKADYIFYIAAPQDHDFQFLQSRLTVRGSGRTGALTVLRAATTEMARRRDLMLEERKQTFRQLASAPKPIVIILDGVLELLRMDLHIGSPENKQRAELGGMIDAIAQYGAKTGFCLLIATSKPASALIADRLLPHLHELTAAGAQLILGADGSGVFTPVDEPAVRVRMG